MAFKWPNPFSGKNKTTSKEVKKKSLGEVARERFAYGNPTSDYVILNALNKVKEAAAERSDTRSKEDMFYLVAREALVRAAEVCSELHLGDYEAQHKEYEQNEPLLMLGLMKVAVAEGLIKEEEMAVEEFKKLIDNHMRSVTIETIQKDHLS